MADRIRNELIALGFEIKDTKDGFEWKLNKKAHHTIMAEKEQHLYRK